MSEPRNPYFTAVEARDRNEADRHFRRLVNEAVVADPSKAVGDTREAVVASLCYVAGYYGEETRRRVAHLYSWRSPYRNS